MVYVRFGTGSIDDFDIHYDTKWPVVPRIGEHLSMVIGTDQLANWRVKDVSYLGEADETLIGVLVLLTEA